MTSFISHISSDCLCVCLGPPPPPPLFHQEKADRLALEMEELRRLAFNKAVQLRLRVRPLVGSETPFGECRHRSLNAPVMHDLLSML